MHHLHKMFPYPYLGFLFRHSQGRKLLAELFFPLGLALLFVERDLVVRFDDLRGSDCVMKVTGFNY